MFITKLAVANIHMHVRTEGDESSRKGRGEFAHKLTEQERSSSNRIPSPDLGRDFNYEGSVSAAVHLAQVFLPYL